MSQRFDTIKRVSIVSVLINSLLALYKMVVGWLGMSPALFADGIHSLSDLRCDGLVYFAGRYAHQEPDQDHPYGHWRYETFATIVLGAFLVMVGLGISYDSVIRLTHHDYANPGDLTLVAALMSILANEWLFRYTLVAANFIKSDMLRANAYHSRADSLTSVIVLIGLIGSLAGMPAMDTIRSATVTSAELLGVQDDLGSIAAGKLADIVAIEGDPLADISLLTKVSFVMKNGVIYKQ